MPFTTKVNTSDLAHKALWQLLADTDHGLNPRLTQALADAGLTAPASWRLPFHFTDTSLNVFPVDIEPVIGTTSFPFTYPMLTVFGVGVEDVRLEKFYSFAGRATIGINLFVSLGTTNVPRQLGPLVDVCQNALLSTISDVAFGTWATDYDKRLVFGGGLSASRQPPVKGADAWYQALQMQVPFEVHSR